MKELIELKNQNGIETVSARELHEKLKVNTKFADWIKRMIEYGFQENTDYTVLKNEKGDNGQFSTIEYYISLDMAKEICMLQRSEIGRKFRQYFIKCEKELRNKSEKYKEVREKSKKVRNQFTDTLKERGYSLPFEYIQTTTQMKSTLGITAKKDSMNVKELQAITASEALSELLLTDEFGFLEVNPVCINASEIVNKAVESKKMNFIY